MDSFTLTNLKRDSTQGQLYNIFKQTYIDNDDVPLQYVIVQEEEEMRLDKVCVRLYGTRNYIEELMQINDIINIWNVKKNDIIYYTPFNNLSVYKRLEKEIDKAIAEISKEGKNTRVDPKRETGVPPTIRPIGLKTLTIDHKTKKIKLLGKLS